MSVSGRIRLEHGSGGALSRELVDEVIFPRFSGPSYADLNDASEVTPLRRPCMTTDSFVVDPIFFPGSDIGKLAVFGSCNDLAVSGARPIALSLGLILEEGLPIETLERVLDSVSAGCEEAGVAIVTGDTKVVPKGAGGGIYINTAALGDMEFEGRLTTDAMACGDRIVISGPIGAHGIAVLGAREGLPVSPNILSDCRNLYPFCRALYPLGSELRIMRDATRGGIAAITNELVDGRPVSIVLDEERIPVEPEVAAASRLLGLNPLEIANEGVFVTVVDGSSAAGAVRRLKRAGCSSAAIIGEVTAENPGRVVLETSVGGHRILDLPRGLLLPRIC